MLTVEELRQYLRLTSEKLDGEIQDTMDAARLDLASGGMDETDNALTDMAVKLYARWQFDYRGKGEEYRRAYESLKAVLSMCEEYRGGGGNE